ncbi:MAG: YraN family protein [Pyrinomonadaceae bacterium]
MLRKILSFRWLKRPASPERRSPSLDLGRRGERLAAEYLERAGYSIVATNFHISVGRNLRGAVVRAEIDVIAYEGATLCFIEVKTRASVNFAAPERNVDLRKRRQISRAARAYRRLLGQEGAPHRFDVVSIVLPAPAHASDVPSLQLFRGFWVDHKPRPRESGGNFYVE